MGTGLSSNLLFWSVTLMFKRTKISTAALLAVAGFLSSTAMAQGSQRIEVTGSAIKRIDSETSIAVTVLKTADLAKLGVTNAEQALAFIAQNQVTIGTTDSVGSSTGGAAYADLRGLGIERTLVLVNGKRMVSNPYSSVGVDLNALPMASIERIEILADGASAIYGSDAIAGVINFITKREFTGFNIAGDYSYPTNDGDGKSYSASITGGFGNLAEQGWNVFGGFSYRRQNALAAVDRDFAKSAVIADRGVFKASPTTFPANYSQGATVAANPTGQACEPPFSLFLPDVFGPDACGFDYVPFIDIIPEQTQSSFFLKGSTMIGGTNTLSAEYMLAKNEVVTFISPTPLGGLSMNPNSPFYPGNGTTPSNAALDITKPISLGWRTSSVGGRNSIPENDTDRLLVSLDGQLGKWDYSTTILRSTSTVTNTFAGGYLNNAGIRAGLNGLNGAPFLNPFGPQSPEGQAYLQSQLILGEVQKAEGTLTGIAGRLVGEAFKMPAGSAMVAISADYHKDEVEYRNNFDLIRQAASSGLAGAEDIEGDRNFWSIAGELDMPIIKNLDLNLAIRYDDYSDFGTTWNPKISAKWRPMDMLLVRASYNTGFRAPTLQDVYAPNSLTFTGARYNDPVLCPNGVADVAAGGIPTRDCNIQFQQQQGGNQELEAEESNAWNIGFVVQPTANTSIGLDFWDYKVEKSIGTVGEQQIFSRPDTYAANFVRCSAAKPSEVALIDACQIPGGDPLAYIKNTQLNLGDYKTSGIDLTASWRSGATSWGTFSAALNGTYISKFEYQFEPGLEFNNNLGRYFNSSAVPRYKQVLQFGWNTGAWSTNLANRYTRGYEDANAEAGMDPAFYNTVDAYSVWDLAVTWTGIKGLALTAGLTNMLDEDPPFSNQADSFQVGFDQRYSNPIGRALFMRASYTF
jgi:iron complex outermembrane receptor protein